MPGPIDLAGLAVVVVALWVLTVIFRVKSRWHLYIIFRRALLTAVVVAIAVFCWNLATSLR
jgi:hypothetical protein